MLNKTDNRSFFLFNTKKILINTIKSFTVYKKVLQYYVQPILYAKRLGEKKGTKRKKKQANKNEVITMNGQINRFSDKLQNIKNQLKS